jgi:hypothetical protein
MSVRFFTRFLAGALLFAAPFVAGASIARADDAAPAATTVAATAPLPVATANPNANTPWDGNVHLNFTPYVWAPTLNATLRYRVSDINSSAPPLVGDAAAQLQTFDTQIGPSDYLGKLNFALMGTITLRKGNWAIFSDALNTNIAGQSSHEAGFSGPLGLLNLSISGQSGTQFVGTIWTIGPSYTVYHDKDSSLDILAGGRFVFLSANANFQLTTTGPLGGQTYSAGASRKDNYGDAILGAYGQLGLGSHWAVPYYADLGTGTPSFTWQAYLGLKYGNFAIGWRHLAYSGGSSTALLQSMSLGGPMLGYTLHF